MPAQTSKKTLLSTRSIVLDTLDASSFYDVSLSGNGLAAVAHTNLAGINSQLRGDTLRALGSNNTLTGGAGNDLLISSGANNLLVAAAGSDTLVSGPDGTAFLVANAAQLNASSISGGAGTDTLRLGAGIRATDNQFSRIRGVEVLSLGGGASVTLAGSARAAGISSVVTGAGGGTVQGGAYAGSLTLEAGSAGRALLAGSATQANLFRATGAALATSTMIGGAGRDTLAVTGGAVADAVFQRTRGMDFLSLGGGASVTLAGSARAAGISSVVTGAGGGTVQGGAYAGSLTLEAGSAGRALLAGSATQANLFRASAAALATSTLTGGVRNDTLSILAGGTNQLSDSLFANLSRLDTLLLPGGGGSSVTLGAGAQRAGFTSIIGSNDGVAIRQEPRQTRAMTLVGGEGADLFSFASTALAAANSIIGGDGSDTISVDTGTMADPFFRKVSGIEVLSLGTGSSATLGNTASSKGLRTVVTGASNVTVQAGSMEAALTLDASAVPGRVFLSGSTGGSLFLLGDADALGSSTLRGGAGADTLSMKSAGSYTDSSFARMRGIEVMQLSGGGNNVVLGASAALSGILTLVSGTAGGDTIAQMAGGYFLDASAATEGVYFRIASPTLISGSDAGGGTTVVGGEGTDTLIIGTGDFTDTAFFKNISGVEAVLFEGQPSGGAITLDGGLDGFTTIVGSSGDMTFTQTEGAFVIDGRAGETNLFDLTADGKLLAEDTILGGEGIDTLNLGEATFDEDPFANVTSVEFVSLTGASSIILGDAASAAGVSSLYGGEEGDSTIQVDSGSYYLNGAASSSNLFVLLQSSLLGENTIIGNNDSDTLAVGDGPVRDVDFGNLSGVGILSLMGSDSNFLQLGGIAVDAGVSTVYGGEGNATVDLLAGAYDFEAGDAAGTFRINAADSAVMGASTFTGNGEGSTIAFSEGEITDDAFANVKDVGSILLEGSSAITLEDAAANAGIGSVIGGSGETTFTQTAGSYILDGSGGTSNLFALSSASLAAGNTIIGAGAGADTLAITEEDSLDDTAFANMTGINLLSLTGSSSVTLGSAAAESGVVELIMGDGDSSILLDSDAPSILLDGEGSSSLFVGITDAALAAASTLYGGTGTDTLAFGDGNSIEDESFTNVQGFEVVSVTGGSSVTLGAAVAAGGLDSIYGGEGINTITQSAENTNALYIDGGEGQLQVELDSVYNLLNDTILGGSGGENTLSVNGSGNIFDSYFANQERLQTVILAGDNSVELGSAADAAGVNKVIVEDGDNIFMVAADGPAGVTLDARGGTGENRFTFENAGQLLTARVYGSDGEDTLSFGRGALIGDSLFARADDIEVLVLGGASDVTLGSNADNTRISTVIGGSGGTAFTQDALSGGSYYLDGSASAEEGNRFTIADTAQLAKNTLMGGDGFDTLQVGVGAIDDLLFTNLRSIEVLKLTGAGSGSVELGINADRSGLISVVGGSGENIFTHASGSDAAYHLDGSDGDDMFIVDRSAQAAIDTFVGGAGTDTLKIGQGGFIEDFMFGNHNLIDALQLSGSSDVTLGAEASRSGISTIYGGSGATSLDSSAMTGSLVINASAGSGTSLLLAGSGADSINGGSGSDTLQGWAATGNSASDTLFGGGGADLFVLGNAAGNGYGTSGSKALISDFTGGTDYLQLKDYAGSGASSYRIDATAGSGYSHQLFDISGGGSGLLLANINYSGTNASDDLLGSKVIFA